MRRLVLFLLVCCIGASATTYYVSNSGTDAPGCTSAATACKTLAYVDGIALQPGDSVLLQRGGTWNEVLIPPASGVSGNPITYDAYGSGAAPVLTPVIDLSTATWTHNSGNIYTTSLNTPISSPQIYNLRVGNVWGKRRTANPACTTVGVIQGFGDFCVVYPTLYLYSPNGTLPPAYYGTITPVVSQAAGLAVVSIVNKSWLVFQHIKIQNFDYLGVSVSGASDNLVFANMESDGTVPYGTTPHGFYVNASSGHGVNVQFLNDDANLNYDGFRVDSAGSVSVTNCRGYANRDAGLRDNTTSSNVVTLSYSHFYGNNVAQLPTTDVIGGIVGSGNVALVCGGAAALPAGMCSSTAAPVVANVATYPARFSFTVDDVGSSPGTEAYINSFLSTFSSRPGVKFNAAVVPSYAGLNGQNAVDWISVNSWYASGNEIDSHSWSHQYYTTTGTPLGTCTPSSCPNTPALKIQYTGNGTAATMTVSGTTLSTNVTGAPADNISINLVNAPYNQMGKTGSGGWGLANYLNTLPHYSVVMDTDAGVPMVRPNTHTVNLAGTTGSATSISGQDIKTAPFVWVYDQALLLADEMAASKSTIESNVPGLVERVYVYPDGIEDTTSEAAAVAAGYSVGRGSLAMKGQDNSTGSANSFYSNGVNVQNITSLAVIPIHGMTQGQVNQIAASLVFRAGAWGVPYALFTHYNSRGDNTPDISNTELGWLLDAIQANGGVWMTNTALGNAISAPPGATAISGTTRYVQNPSGSAVNLAVAQANSPTVGQGLTTAYPVDLNGMDRSRLGTWDIGASSYLSQRYGAAGGTGSTRIGGWAPQQSVSLPLSWVNSHEMDAIPADYTINFPASGSGGSWTCVSTPYGPYTASSQASLNQVLKDMEHCRTQNNKAMTLVLPAGSKFSGPTAIAIPQSSNTLATKPLRIMSSADASLPDGTIVCVKGIQDNLATSTDIFIDNPACNGSGMYYALGTTVTNIPAGAFTLANGTAANTANYNDLQYLWTIENTGSNQDPLIGCSPISTAGGLPPPCESTTIGPDHWIIADGEPRLAPGGLSNVSNVRFVQTGNETSPAQLASHIHLRHMWAHGDWLTLDVGANQISQGFVLACVYCSVEDSYTSQSLRPGMEGHAVNIAYGQQIKLVHNVFEGAAIGLITGGFAYNVTYPLDQVSTDLQIGRNRWTFPLAWLGQAIPATNASWHGQSTTRKNPMEYKICRRCVLYGNYFENVDNSGVQFGVLGPQINVRNCAASLQCNNYQTAILDFAVYGNIYRNGCQGSTVAAGSGYPANGGGTAVGMNRIFIEHNLWYGVTQSNPGCQLGMGTPIGLSVARTYETWQATITRDSTGTIATATMVCSNMISGNCPAGPPTTGLTQTQIQVGDPVSVYGCTGDTTFNTPANPLFGAPSTAKGALATTGTNPNGLTVVFPSVGPANSTDATLTCTVSNLQGYPANFSVTHNTVIVDTNMSGIYNGIINNGAGFAQNGLIRDNIFTGGMGSSSAEGYKSENLRWDVTNFTMDHNVWATRPASAYYEYGNNPNYPDSAGCTGTGCNPPLTELFPATAHCTGATPTSSCIGFGGAMGATSMPLMLNDYHQFGLRSDSVFHNTASDGTDRGANINIIDRMQTQNPFVCPAFATCSSNPYPD